MDKIVIIGSPGSGKSTIARKLGRKLHIKVVHLDRIFWQPGWEEKPRDTRIEILQELVRENQWIIEGTYLDSSEPRLKAADAIIFLDIPSFLCLQRVIKQHYKTKGHPRHDLKEGCEDKLNLIRILKVLGFPFRGRRWLKLKLSRYSRSKAVICLHSTKEVEDFLAQLEPYAYEKRKLSKASSAAKNRHLAVAKRKPILQIY
jgi:adenylate kinase family enzyme